MTITLQSTSHFPSKVIALLLVSVLGMFVMQWVDADFFADLASKSPEAFMQEQKELHQQSLFLHFISALILGAFYIGLVEVLASVIYNRIIPRRKNPMATSD